jgi:hypothetical protein
LNPSISNRIVIALLLLALLASFFPISSAAAVATATGLEIPPTLNAAGNLNGAQSALTAALQLTVQRSLPTQICGGQSFNVALAFSAPANDFNAIDLTDYAPAGWKVETDQRWNTPPGAAQSQSENRIDYFWNSPCTKGTAFQAVYKVTAPEDAAAGLYQFSGGTLKHSIGSSGPTVVSNIANSQVQVVEGTLVQGAIFDSQGLILEAVTISLDGTPQVTSDAQGDYRLLVPVIGSHTLTASKPGFRSQTRTLTTSELTDPKTLDFKADYGLVPNKPDISYVLACINKWKFPPSDGTALNLSKIVNVINAWKYPISIPEVISSSPQGANVAVNSVVAVVFSEKINPNTLTTASFVLLNDNQTVAGTITYNDRLHTATFTPGSSLVYETTYTALITTAVANAGGYSIASDYRWSFTTAESPGPHIMSVRPADGASKVGINASVNVDFVASVKPTTITNSSFVLYQGNQRVAGNVFYSDAYKTAVFKPTSVLAYATTYSAKLTTAITDQLGNPLYRDYCWSFTTIAEDEICQLTIGGPSTVTPGGNLDITIDCTAVDLLVSWQTEISYDTTVLQVVGLEGASAGVTKGLFGSTLLPVDMWSFKPVGIPGKIGVVGHTTPSVSGSGYLMIIHFKVIGAAGKSSFLNFSGTKLFDFYEDQIGLATHNRSVSVTAP